MTLPWNALGWIRGGVRSGSRWAGPVLLAAWLCAGCIEDFHNPPIPTTCGDATLEGQEGCDDGNTADGDGCSGSCTVEPGWHCQGAPSSCDTFCGDSIRAGEEACDGTDFGGTSCGSLGFVAGTLACDSDCATDTTGCAVCGDGVCDGARDESVDNCVDDCGFVQLAVGSHFSCATRADGTVWCWGDNEHGQLGAGSLVPLSDTPLQVSGITTALQVDVGDLHACALAVDDASTVPGATAVWCWGGGQVGQVGSPDLMDHRTPVKVPDLGAQALQVDVGYRFSCALLEGGRVKCWGNHQYAAGGTTWSLGHCALQEQTSFQPLFVDNVTTATRVSADASNGCVLLVGGEVVCWGANHGGERGIGTTDDSCPPTTALVPVVVETFVMGDHYAIALDAAGDAWAWGDNLWGQLGDGTVESRLAPVALTGLPALRSVGLGWDHTCGVTQDGGALCWGRNDLGQLGTGVTDTTFQPPTAVDGLESGVQEAVAGRDFSCALLDSGRIRCWGANQLGQLGTGTLEGALVPQEVLLP